MLSRRTLLAGAVAGAVLPLAAEAQQAGKVHRVGYVVPAPGPNPVGQGFDRGLREAGLIEGKNVIVDRQYMGGREHEYATVLADIEKRVDVIVVAAPPAALAAKKVVTKGLLSLLRLVIRSRLDSLIVSRNPAAT
jgi:putative tryptophan/tyrosine transport system substrate-binding protein